MPIRLQPHQLGAPKFQRDGGSRAIDAPTATPLRADCLGRCPCPHALPSFGPADSMCALLRAAIGGDRVDRADGETADGGSAGVPHRGACGAWEGIRRVCRGGCPCRCAGVLVPRRSAHPAAGRAAVRSRGRLAGGLPLRAAAAFRRGGRAVRGRSGEPAPLALHQPRRGRQPPSVARGSASRAHRLLRGPPDTAGRGALLRLCAAQPALQPALLAPQTRTPLPARLTH
eukprot:scaffold117030_cov58-Phaeocystis_antarctica.AAC.4